MAGAGDLILSALQGPRPDAQIAAALNPAVGGPQAAPGGPGSAQMSPAGPQMAPAQAPAPDPVNANLTSLLLQQYRRDQASAGIDRGLTNMVAGMRSSPQSAHDLTMQAAGIQPQNTLGAIGDIQKIQGEATAQQEHAKFAAGADLFGQTVLGLKPGQGAYLANDPELLRTVITRHFADMSPTEMQKNLGAWEGHARASGMSEQDIQQQETIMLGGAVSGGIDPIQKDMNRDLGVWRTTHPGETPPSYLTNTTEYAADKKAQLDKGAEVTQAQGALASNNILLGQMETDVGKISANPEVLKGIVSDPAKRAAAKALFNAAPDAQFGPAMARAALSQPEIDAIVAIRNLHLKNYQANFHGSQRLSQQEATRLGQAADQFGNFDLSPDAYIQGIEDAKKKIGQSRANAYGAAQDFANLPVEDRPKVDPAYLPGGAYAPRGAAAPDWAKPVEVNSEADLARVPYGQAYRAGPQFGKYSGKVLYKGLENQFEG